MLFVKNDTMLHGTVLRRLASTLLLLWFAALGAGVLEYVHNLQHSADDARAASLLAQSSASANGQRAPATPVHDDSNCPIHAQLHTPLLSAGWVPLLVCLGLFVAFLTLLAPALASHGRPARIDCRGPPAFA